MAWENHICFNCYLDIPYTYFWNNPSPNIISLFFYTDKFKPILYKIKYHQNIGAALFFGEMLGEKIANSITPPIDYIIPVPLHPLKILKRGYNQSYIIAKGVIRGIEKENKKSNPLKKNNITIIEKILKRRRFTNTQTKKGKLDRKSNVEQAFYLNTKVAKLLKPNCHILLIDDVITTGATINACKNKIEQAINCKITIATLSYVE